MHEEAKNLHITTQSAAESDYKTQFGIFKCSCKYVTYVVLTQ
jgi:hypothetical protein